MRSKRGRWQPAAAVGVGSTGALGHSGTHLEKLLLLQLCILAVPLFRPLLPLHLQPAARDASAANTLAAAMKQGRKTSQSTHRGSLCRPRHPFSPYGSRDTGWLGACSQLIFKAIARATAQKSGVPDSVATAQLCQALGVRLQRANARAILLRTAAAAGGCANTTFAITSRSKAALVLTTAANAG